MSYNVLSVPPFDRQLKRLAKKYPSLKSEYAELILSLEANPTQGRSLGNNCYKIRLAIKSKVKGKSGGARVITNFVVADDTVFLLTIYDKSSKVTLTDNELKALLQSIPE